MDCSTPGFLVLHHFLELAQTHVHRVGDAIQPSRPLLSPSPPAFNFSQHQGLFQWVGSSHQVGQSIGASASASILPINIRDWFPLGWTGLSSLQSRWVQLSSVQSLSCVWLFATPWIAARQASLYITNFQSSLRLMSIKSVMPSSHLILCRPLLLLPPIPPSISLFQWVNSSHEVAKVLEFQL